VIDIHKKVAETQNLQTQTALEPHKLAIEATNAETNKRKAEKAAAR